jgi:hypothetical protein
MIINRNNLNKDERITESVNNDATEVYYTITRVALKLSFHVNNSEQRFFTRADLISQLRAEETILRQAIEGGKEFAEVKVIYDRMKVIYIRLLDWRNAIAWVDPFEIANE